MNLKRTGVFATVEEADKIKNLTVIARHTPVIAFSSEDALQGRDASSLAWKSVHETTHAAALAHGLPELPGYYGIDLSNREFVTV